jgi:hypothetical protein
MQGGQSQFKLDQPGLIKAAPVALGAAAVVGLLYAVYAVWGILGILGWAVTIFAGVWYVMTVRKSGTLPDQMNGLVHGAILGAAAGLVSGIVQLVTLPIGAQQAVASLGLGDLGGFGTSIASAAIAQAGVSSLLSGLIFGAIAGAVGAFGYSYLVKQGTIK